MYSSLQYVAESRLCAAGLGLSCLNVQASCYLLMRHCTTHGLAVVVLEKASYQSHAHKQLHILSLTTLVVCGAHIELFLLYSSDDDESSGLTKVLLTPFLFSVYD